MRFSWKIFIITFLIIIFSFGMGGFILISSVFQSSLNGMIDSVVRENRLVCEFFNTIMANTEAPMFGYTLRNFTSQLSEQTKIYIDDKSKLTFYNEGHFVNSLAENEQGYQIISSEDESSKYIQIVSFFIINEKSVYIETVVDITEIFTLRDKQYDSYRIVLLCVAFFSSVAILVFSHYITKPLKILSDIAHQIADGRYDMRVPLLKRGNSEEVVRLTENFNIMAQNVEDYINRLKDEARRQEDFVGNFTHELKTPMTSIIGYADMLRSVALPEEERRMAADYIYREGKRLESLSLHLLNLIVVRNCEIKLTRKRTADFFKDIKKSLHFTMEKYGMRLLVKTAKATVILEPMLIKTVILNLSENACKASEVGQHIIIEGMLEGEKYKISVSDRGCGIPEEKIGKITEAFYMVDKSRAREKGSAGLGLALCEEILKLHGTVLSIKSSVGKGTTVSFYLGVAENEET